MLSWAHAREWSWAWHWRFRDFKPHLGNSRKEFGANTWSWLQTPPCRWEWAFPRFSRCVVLPEASQCSAPASQAHGRWKPWLCAMLGFQALGIMEFLRLEQINPALPPIFTTQPCPQWLPFLIFGSVPVDKLLIYKDSLVPPGKKEIFGS